MLAAEFVNAEIRQWLEEARPNLQNPLEYLPQFAMQIIKAYEIYKRQVSSIPLENPYLQDK